MKYEFKRSVYYDTIKSIKQAKVTFLLGPRKCGKTVCMKQICDTLDNTVYVDVKSSLKTDSQKIDFIKLVVKDIEDDKDVIYLIDEATYLFIPDKDIAEIANAFSDFNNKNTKIVFSGSQSRALDFWGHLAFAGNAAFVNCDFLAYPEWLAYKGNSEVSEKTYIEFIFNTREFYSDFNSIREYLQGCLDETVISNRKAIEYAVDNCDFDLGVEALLDVLYGTLISLHNRVAYKTFADAGLFERTLISYFSKEVLAINNEELAKRIDGVLGRRYSNFKEMTGHDCLTALQFLSNCGLVSITYQSDELKVDPYVATKLLKESSELYLKPDVFDKFNITVNYPMFYLELVKSVLQNDMPDEIPRSLLGSIVECHVRSLLPTTGCFEYRTRDGIEIDYVDTSGLAIEISVANKHNKDTNFDKLPDSYRKILLTKNSLGTVNGIEHIPYYQFIFDKSAGKDLVNGLNKGQLLSEKCTSMGLFDNKHK